MPDYTIAVHRMPLGAVAVLQAGVDGRPCMGDLVLQRHLPGCWQCLVVDFMGHGDVADRIRRDVEGDARAALELDSPSGALQALNRATFDRLRGVRSYATAICARLVWEPRPVLAFASAGHVPPVALWTGGVVRTIPARGLMLGVHREYVYVDHRVELADWRALILYTDGLLDLASDEPAPGGMEELVDAVRQAGTDGPIGAEAMAAGIFRAMRAHRDRGPRDDVSLLVVSAMDVTAEDKGKRA
ncbi:MAG: serine/threonine-protein phosphatase [Clostridia bacterium]|nr:serine/threonine-protein phosphatase [Clostridia bacterium]